MACRFTAFTVTNNPEHPGAERLRRSAKYWGWDLKWIPQNEGWERKTFKAQQLGQLRAFQEYEPDFFLYTDAWDTIFCGPPQELQLKRGELNFCGDTILGEWQDKSWSARFVPEAFPPAEFDAFRYVNDGVIWGDTAIFRELAGDYLQNYGEMINQDYFNLRYAFETGMRRYRLKVDQRATVALNIMGLLLRTFVRRPNNRPEYLPFHSHPLIIHSPGTGLSEPLAPMPKWLTEAFSDE